jgi:SAM-dependent methyltransferase
MGQTQAELWSGEAGEAWVRAADELDPRLEGFGRAAMHALAPRLGERILDVGCGSGATTRELARLVGTTGEVVGVDVSRPLMVEARSRGGGPNYVEADAAAHVWAQPFAAIYSRFGVMFFEQPEAAFTSLHRAAPHGRLAFVCWRSLDENPGMTRPLEAARHLLPEPPPPDPDAPGPFALARRDKIERILGAAGWHSIVVTPLDSTYELGATPELATEMALTIGPLARAVRETPDAAAAVRQVVGARFAADAKSGPVVYPAAVWIVTARAA